jgi:hypothetical protein
MSVRLWKKPSNRQGSFQEIVETARQAFLSDNPNPERKGCPDPQLLMNLAFRRADKESAMRVTLHLRECSDCFREVNDYLQRFNAGRARRLKIGAAAAVIVLIVAASLLLQSQFKKVSSVPQTASGGSQEQAKPRTNDVPSAGTQIAKTEEPLLVVDYIVASATRGPKLPENGPQALVLQGRRLRLRIHLPLGTVAGDYEVRLHRKADKKEVLRAHRSAAKENRFTLAIEEDFAKFPSGFYLLAIFPPGWKGEVQAYPVKIVSTDQN